MIQHVNPYDVGQREPSVVGFDWKGNEIYDYEDYYIMPNGMKITTEQKETVVSFAYQHMKDELLEICFELHDVSLSLDDLVEELFHYGEFIERQH